MNKLKLRWALGLIALTVTVIALFQAYWLQTVYNDNWKSLKRETDVLFRESVYKIQMQKFRRDTALYGSTAPGNLFMFEAMNAMLKTKDTVGKRIVIKNRLAGRDIQINISPKDSLRLFMQDTLKTITNREGLTVTKLQLAINDSLSVKEIDSSYKKELAKAGINVPFKISSKPIKRRGFEGPRQPKVDSFPNKLITGEVSVGLGNAVGYRANFYNANTYIFKQLTYPIIFSVLLLAITIVSFVFLYKNLAAQSRLATMKNEFVSNMTHELKTPIATVGVAIEAMRSFNVLQDPAKAKEYLDISAAELQRLGLLVDKVLKFSMFEEKNIELITEKTDLAQTCNEVILSMRLQLEKHSIKLAFSKDDNAEYIILADRLHMQSVLYNLIDNAIKYSRENGNISIHLAKENNTVIFSIADNGIGIATEYLDKIFDKFFRVPQGNVHNTKGYGLGLSYVAAIIKQHKATIHAQSKAGEGSIFTLKFSAA